MLTSKELIEKTGISRATLNNYISAGLVPRPEVLPPGPHDGDAPRIGYFPDAMVHRIEEIGRLKKEGWSMTRIAAHFAGSRPQAAAEQGVEKSLVVEQPRAAPEPAVPDALPDAAREDAVTRRAPVLTDVAVLASQLQHAQRLWHELPPEEYFELVNQVWSTLETIFRRCQGTLGRYVGDGMACYFLPQAQTHHMWNALMAAVQAREAMRRLSKEWQLRKRWSTELYMNTGIDEGREWHGTLRPGLHAETTVLGNAANHAMEISSFASSGSIWATRNLVVKLPPPYRRQLEYGVHRRNGEGREIFVPAVFARLEDLGEGTPGRSEFRRGSGSLSLTEIISAGAGKPAGGAVPDAFPA